MLQAQYLFNVWWSHSEPLLILNPPIFLQKDFWVNSCQEQRCDRASRTINLWFYIKCKRAISEQYFMRHSTNLYWFPCPCIHASKFHSFKASCIIFQQVSSTKVIVRSRALWYTRFRDEAQPFRAVGAGQAGQAGQAMATSWSRKQFLSLDKCCWCYVYTLYSKFLYLWHWEFSWAYIVYIVGNLKEEVLIITISHLIVL